MIDRDTLCNVESRYYAPSYGTIALAKPEGGAYLRDPANSLAITPNPLKEAMEPSC